MAEPRTAILCMAYGSPADEAAIEPYFTHIRGGRPPSPEALEELTARYRAIGGSPLAEITARQAAALSAATGFQARAGYKHAPPFVADVARELAAEGFERLVGLPLAPIYATMSFDGYRRPIFDAAPGSSVILGFGLHPAFSKAVANLLREALADYPADRLFFTAHSLPARIVREGDDYPGRLREACELVAEEDVRLPPWEVAFQSMSRTGEPWLGPDILEAIERSGAKRSLVCPIGFVADHLEILYDLDVEAQAFAGERGIEIRRTASFNDRPEFIAALTAVVETALGADQQTNNARLGGSATRPE